MKVQGAYSADKGQIDISKSVNDKGDYITQITLCAELVKQFKDAQPEEETYVSLEHSIFHTSLGNFIDDYLESYTNFVRLSQAVLILHKVLNDVCQQKISQAIYLMEKKQERSSNE